LDDYSAISGGKEHLMKRVLFTSLLLCVLTLASALPVSAAIHPIVASFCATVAFSNPNVLDPPGQTPASENPNEWDVSDLRALQATGFLTLIRDAAGNVIGFEIDESVPAVKDLGFPAFTRCPNLNP
jgi:hypothetical protein